MPKVTIIVPVYNVEKYLNECLDSLICQTIDDFEVICVNDGSTDNSKDILNDYQNSYPFVKVINHENNKGLSAARNTGIMNATGEYILFIDSDDYILVETCEKLYKYAKETDSDVVFYNLTFLNDYENGFIRNEQIKNDYPGVYSGIGLFAMYQKEKCPKVESVRQFLRRSFVTNNRLYFREGIIHEDILYYFNVCIRANRAVDLNESLYIYRQRGNSINWSQKEKSAVSLMLCIQSMYAQWLLSDKFLDEENIAVRNFIEQIYISYLYAKPYMNMNVQLGNFKEEAVEIVFNNIGYRKIVFMPDDLDKVKNARKVVLYGAGMVATDVINELSGLETNITNVVVTKSVGYKLFYNIEVSKLEDTQLEKDTLFIIATDVKFQDEMRRNLVNCGYRNYVLPIVQQR